MDFKAFTELIEQGVPFHRLLGLRVKAISAGRITLFIPYREALLGDARGPSLHGGVLSTLADLAAGFAVWTCCRLTDRIATIDLRVDFLRPAPPRGLLAEASVDLLGSRVGNARVALWPEGGPETPVAEGRGVYNIRRG